MPRYKFGPVIGSMEIVAAPPPGTKADVDVAFAGVTPEGVFHFEVPAYDLVSHNLLNAVHVGLYALTDTPPTDPSQVLAAPHHFSTSCSALQSGGAVAVDATSAPATKYNALAVLEFDQ